MANFFVQKGKDLFDANVSVTQKVTTVILFTSATLALYFGGKFAVRKIREGIFDKNYGTKPEVSFALRFKDALNPSGMGWLSSVDTTNVDGIYAIAKDMKKANVAINDVRKAYKAKYSEDLIDTIRAELDTTEFSNFEYLAGIKLEKPSSIGIDTSAEKQVTTEGARKIAQDLYSDINDVFALRNLPLYVALAQSSKESLRMIAESYHNLSENKDKQRLKQALDSEYFQAYTVPVNGKTISLSDLYKTQIRPKLP